LDFHSHTGDRKKEVAQNDEDQSIQYRAACALVALLKAQAAPLLEARLDPDKLGRGWAGAWLELYAKTGQARFSPKTRRLAHSADKDVRLSAITALLDGGNPAAVRQNRSWLTDRNAEVRYQAVRNLSEYGGKEDLPLLRLALRDKDDTCELWALRGLIRLNAPELPGLLQRYMRSNKDSSATQEAQLELARRGDRTQLKRLIAWARALHNHTHDHEGWGSEEMQAMEVCEILAARRPVGAAVALRAASTNRCADIQRPAFGALAAMGDVYALTRLRRFAQSGDALQRADAIEWLEICKDHDSEPFLQTAQKDEDPLVQEAAAKALKTLSSGKSKCP